MGRVYLEPVFALNLLVNLLILHIAGRLAGEHARLWRYLLAAALGGLYAAAALLPFCAVLGAPWTKAALSLAMVLLSWRWRGWLPLLKRWGSVLGVTLLGGGAAVAAAAALDGLQPFGPAVRLGENALLLTVLGAASMALLSASAVRRRGAGGHYAVRVWRRGRQVRLEALLDTGNLLCEPVTGLPVMIVEQDLAGQFAAEEDAVVISYGTVGGQAQMRAVPVERVQVRCRGRWRDSGAMYVAFGEGRLGGATEALLPAAALE